MAGHGHVIPNESGLKARCGGPGLCKTCKQEAQEYLGTKTTVAHPDGRIVVIRKRGGIVEVTVAHNGPGVLVARWNGTRQRKELYKVEHDADLRKRLLQDLARKMVHVDRMREKERE